MSTSKRRRRTEDPIDAKDAFLELRDTGLIQTGPKRPKTSLQLTPTVVTRGRGHRKSKLMVYKSKRKSSHREAVSESMQAVEELIDNELLVADVSNPVPAQGTPITLTSAQGTAHTLTPAQGTTHTIPSAQGTAHTLTPALDILHTITPATEKKRESVKATRDKSVSSSKKDGNRKILLRESASPILETPVKAKQTPGELSSLRSSLKSVLKDIHTLSSIRASMQSQESASATKVSFGQYVTVAEFSPDKSMVESPDKLASIMDNSLTNHDVELVEPPMLVENRLPQDVLEPAVETLGEDNADDEEGVVSDEDEGDVVSDEDEGDVVSDNDEEGIISDGGEGGVVSDEDEEREGPQLRTPHCEERVTGRKQEDEQIQKNEIIQPTVSSRVNKAKKPAPPRHKKKISSTAESPSGNMLSRTLIKNLFMLYTRRRLTKEAMELIIIFSEAYLKQATKDVQAFADHAGRKTIEVEDVKVLLQRQREISSTSTFESLVNDHLPMEYVELLLPCPVVEKN